MPTGFPRPNQAALAHGLETIHAVLQSHPAGLDVRACLDAVLPVLAAEDPRWTAVAPDAAGVPRMPWAAALVTAAADDPAIDVQRVRLEPYNNQYGTPKTGLFRFAVRWILREPAP
ncbi:MAG: hypothetical protein OWV35_02635 [Firmicutes bacterium]|nr:hypothetical protein [Bacillota bacterium]